MRTTMNSAHRFMLAALAALALAACAGGPRVEARPQVITFAPAPTPALNQAAVTVSATASSGLPVRYVSRSPAVCSVDATSGAVTAAAAGACTIAASQPGDARFAAALQATQEVVFTFGGVVAFGPPPAVEVHDLATVSAAESTGLPVAFASATPAICSVEAASGLVAGLAEGDCTIDASAGEARASQTFAVSAPASTAPPAAPTGVRARAGSAAGTVEVRVTGLRAGGSAITGWSVTSSPPGVTAAGATLPVTAACPGSCAGYRFVVAARNAEGDGPASAPANVVTGYAVVATFREPDTQPNDSIFVGTFTYDASAGVVSGLRGELSESMTGGPTPYPDDTMTWVPISHQLSAVPVTLDGAAGWLVTAFLLETTGTLTAEPSFGGTDGWAPGSGNGLYFGFPGANPGNAYVRIFVDAADPTAPPTKGQLDKLAYADCAPGGMMGASCMTGTSVAGYGVIGTMGGFPWSQVTTVR